MKTTRTLALAAIAALSVGVGVAMAQTEGPSAPDPNLDTNQQFYVPTPQSAVPANAVQAGSSDVDVTRPASIERDPNYYVNYGTMANPG